MTATASFWREWHENKKSAWTERYAEDVLERITSNIFPYIGNRPINEILCSDTYL